ncbi:SDR family oxidoreductase [Kitasatospora sp. NBC_01287]|uniref:SDR family NAD(P)-dependent oxidoreductase n=1 Tax=Kitasatospora sp. NBC_01287 TaxID=2903573 RepID=UPI00224E8823|nr:SDR family oxidoreductase [Kitasatospora sp. NBC_01287]MCX4745212.1 SDR family oxidoreductase [Kitasatospora sp. NBC_01287]
MDTARRTPASRSSASRSSASRSSVAVLTGASRGLGLALARALAAEGRQLVITARDPDELASAEDELSRLTTVVALAGSVVDDDHRAELAAAASRLGGASLLVNNASTLNGSADEDADPLPSLATYPLPDLLETFEVNVLAPIALTQLLLPQLRQHEGAVLNISSDAAVQAYAGWGGYGAAKAALDHVSAVLAAEEPELRVWAVDPGDLRTRLHQQAFPDADLSGLPLPATVVPAFRALWRTRPASGRYRAAALLADAALGSGV